MASVATVVWTEFRLFEMGCFTKQSLIPFVSTVLRFSFLASNENCADYGETVLNKVRKEEIISRYRCCRVFSCLRAEPQSDCS